MAQYQAQAYQIDPEMQRALEVAALAEQEEHRQRMRDQPPSQSYDNAAGVADLEAQEVAPRPPLQAVHAAERNPLGQVLPYRRNEQFRGVPQGNQAYDEGVVLRVQYMQQAMVTMMCALMCAMVSKYVHSIEIKHEESKEEKVFVETMFQLFSIHWMMATAFNFLLASDPNLESSWSQNVCDFLIGAILGVNVVILIEYMRGFFVEGQDESDFIHVLSLGLQLMGAVYWSIVFYVLFLIGKSFLQGRERRQRRMNVINQMQTIPYANLAINVDITCSICLVHFKEDDQILQLRCHNSHIFHKDCISEWVRQSNAQCPLCKQNIRA